MRQLLLFAMLVFELANPASTFAECPTITSATEGSTCVSDVMLLGMRGTWFDMANTNSILHARLVNEQLTIQVDEYSKLVASWKKENKALRDALTLREDTQRNLQAQLALANKDAREARAELAASHRWYKSPVFWGIAMFVAGAAIQNICCSGR